MKTTFYISFITLIFALQINTANAQFFIKTNYKPKAELGLNYASVNLSAKNLVTYDNEYLFISNFRPYVGAYFFKSILSAGLRAEYQFFSCTLIDLPNLYGIGAYIKINYPFQIKYSFLKRLYFFSEINYLRTNYTFDSSLKSYFLKEINIGFDYPVKQSSLNKQNINLLSGVKVRFWRGLNAEISARYTKFIDGYDYIEGRIGLSYDFGLPPIEPKVKEPEIKKEKIKSENNDFFKTFIFGTSLTYMVIRQISINADYKEFTWHINASASLNKLFYAGIEFMKIAVYDYTETNYYNLTGLFLQFDFLGKTSSKTRLYFDSSINYGNIYFDYIDFLPAKRQMWYFGFGGGIELTLGFLSKNFYLDLGLYNYHPLNRIKTKSNFTQYIIGINYHIGKRIKDKAKKKAR